MIIIESNHKIFSECNAFKAINWELTQEKKTSFYLSLKYIFYICLSLRYILLSIYLSTRKEWILIQFIE